MSKQSSSPTPVAERVPSLSTHRDITFTINGRSVSATVNVRTTLLDFIRDDLRLRGTHVGCEHGVCGCCNVTFDGDVVRSCLLLAYQVDGHTIGTIEGLEQPDGSLSPVQQAFCDHHALQCGYCTPGMIVSLEALLDEDPQPTEDALIETVAANLCRCTGYQQILDAARSVVASRASASGTGGSELPGEASG